jgi:cytochrome c oxidase subunit 2
MWSGTPLFPEQASTMAARVDNLYFFLLAVAAFFTVLIAGLIVYYAFRYRRRAPDEIGVHIHGGLALELTWTIVPALITVVMFVWGSSVFFAQQRPPDETVNIYVVGKQWMWKIQHGTGQREINELHVPVGRDILLTLTTEDVIHDFGMPAFRTKVDVVPGRYTKVWFHATKPGKYHLFCQEYCGLNHSGMGGWIYVMEQKDFDSWLGGNASQGTPVEIGKDLFQNKLGCASCHAGGPGQRGAPLENIFGKPVKLVGGQTVTVDDNYIRNSILNPSSQVVEGYQPIMPTFKGQVTEEQLNGLVAYIKSLSGVTAGSTTGTTTTNAASTSTTGGSNSNAAATNSMTPPRADRGNPNPGSNPNAPAQNSNR